MKKEIDRKSICFFIHYSELPRIPLYVILFVEELACHFDEVQIVTNERCISQPSTFSKKNISIFFTNNEGYDFGKFYKAYNNIEAGNYYRIAVINDSNVLFNKLNKIFTWASDQSLDFWGIVDSHESPWFSSHQQNYHIQSHFLVFEEKAINYIVEYFNEIDIDKLFSIKDTKELRRKVINCWEIGLSRFFFKKNLHIGSYINSKWYDEIYNSGKISNVVHQLYYELIQSGYPMIKRKIIDDRKRKLLFFRKKRWKKLLYEHGNLHWDIKSIISEIS